MEFGYLHRTRCCGTFREQWIDRHLTVARLKRSRVAGLSALALSAPAVVVSATAAGAAGGRYYSSCDALHRDYRYGVAKSDRAARRQVRDGYHRPATTRRAKRVYWTNHSRLDRDDDGTACEA